MQKKDLQQFRAWFDSYVAGFYGDDEYVNTNLKMKEDHTRRVCQETSCLAEALKLSNADMLIAATIALLHDVGRFEQFIVYRTYNDPRSENHCLLGLSVLKKHDVLAPLDQPTRQIIETAIRVHGEKELESSLDERTGLFAKLIRDADKLDIYHVVLENFKRFAASGGECLIEREFPNEPICSTPVVNAVLNGELIAYPEIKTANDFKLLMIGWVYDVNFCQTLARIREKLYIAQLLARLPRTAEMMEVGKCIFKYVDERIENGK